MSTPSEAATPEQYIARLEEPRKSEVRQIHDLIRREAAALEPHIAAGMLAYGTYRYRYASGREGEWFPIGLSSRKNYISLYVNAADGDNGYVAERFRERLPKADIGKSCVRIKRLSDVEIDALAELIRAGAKYKPESAA